MTGAAGFVGRHLRPALENAGWEVAGADRELDVADSDAVAARVASEAPDLVVHLAAVSSVPEAGRDPELAFRVNYLGTRSVLEAALQRAPRARVLVVGSGDAYGPAAPGSSPYREGDPLRPGSPYGRTKAAADLLGAAYAERGLHVVRTRAWGRYTIPKPTWWGYRTLRLPRSPRSVANSPRYESRSRRMARISSGLNIVVSSGDPEIT